MLADHADLILKDSFHFDVGSAAYNLFRGLDSSTAIELTNS